ncbi:MAG: hypothetical protein CM15mP116_08610 [Synechococcus sp.]|nr:MAG: hypothetical protein CM15mP116_08610 [Synechococcus sp.]
MEIGVANQRRLLEVLAQNDPQWQPRLVVHDDGRREYTYRLPKGAPELSLPEIKALLRSPPDYSTMLNRSRLFDCVESLRVTVVITEPNRAGALASGILAAVNCELVIPW